MNKKALYIILAVIMVAVIVMVALGPRTGGLRTDDTNNNVATESSLTGTNWIWKDTKNLDGSVTTPKDPSKFVLLFLEDGTFSTTTDCNNAGGTYIRDGEVLSLGEMMSTLKFCEGSQETEYTSMLAQTGSYVISGNTLTLNLNRDVGTMTFTAQPVDTRPTVIDAPLPPNSIWVWTVTQRNGQEIKAEGTPFMVTFGSDNKFTGTGDCNSYFGAYTLTGKNGITISDIGMTKKFCEGSKENIFTGDLAKAESYIMEGNMLRMTLSDGSLMLLSRRPTPIAR